jgi:hypothetical protein
MLKSIAVLLGFDVARSAAKGIANQEFVFHRYEDTWLMVLIFAVAMLALWGFGRFQKRQSQTKSGMQ